MAFLFLYIRRVSLHDSNPKAEQWEAFYAAVMQSVTVQPYPGWYLIVDVARGCLIPGALRSEALEWISGCTEVSLTTAV